MMYQYYVKLLKAIERQTVENYWKSIGIASVPAEIGTKHNSNMSLERYRYANPLGHNVFTVPTITTNT
jgi:hypothetical protein